MGLFNTKHSKLLKGVRAIQNSKLKIHNCLQGRQLFIAFLRAINVGGHTVKMDELRRHFGSLGFRDVETFIASGNVIFESDDTDAAALEKRTEAHLKQALGYEVATFIRSAAELAQIACFEPFPAVETGDGSATLYIGFLHSEPGEEARQKVLDLQSPVDEFVFHGRELYWLCRTRMSESTVSGARLEKALGMQTTLRNSTTVRKLGVKYAPTGE